MGSVLYEIADGWIAEANREKCSYDRKAKIRKACKIYDLLKTNFGHSSGDIFLAAWGAGESQYASRDVLRQANFGALNISP